MWKYNDLTIEDDELKSVALNAAENYYYDMKQGGRPVSPMRTFFDDFGKPDDEPEQYEGLFHTYLTYYAEFLDDPAIQAKYNEDEVGDEEDEVSDGTWEKFFGNDPVIRENINAIKKYYNMSATKNNKINETERILEKLKNPRNLAEFKKRVVNEIHNMIREENQSDEKAIKTAFNNPAIKQSDAAYKIFPDMNGDSARHRLSYILSGELPMDNEVKTKLLQYLNNNNLL
jgi:hypothetical protein